MSIVALAVATILPSQVQAQTQTRQFDLPAQSAASGAKEFARQAGIQIIVAGRHAEGRTTNAIRDSLDPRIALDRLVAGTGLTVRSFDGEVAILVGDEEQDGAALVVTGSRIVRDGYEAPTPLTVLGREEIERAAQVNLAEQISRLPALAGSNNPRNTASNISGGFMGISSLNLRNLGATRTLVLLDSQRLPAASLNGLVDANSIPGGLVKRVDVVTGGASAAWGSDAVAGVVNYVLDKEFTGVRGEVQGGVTTYGDDRNYKISLSAGTDFAGGRGHVLVSGENWYSEGIEGMPRDWYRGRKTLVNPSYSATNGQPYYLVRDNVGYTTVAPGAIVTTGPLQGLYFGEGGTPAQLNYGSTVSNPFMVGGDWRYTDFGNGPQNLDPELSHRSVFTRLSYDVADAVKLFGEFSFVEAKTKTTGTPMFNFGGIIIQRDNAFLPSEVGEAMDAAKVTTLNVGTWNSAIGGIVTETRHDLYRYAIGAEGTVNGLGTEWNWIVRANRNISKFYNGTNIPITANYTKARDAVRNSSGAIVCRSTLTDPTNGCVPLNILGTGVASRAALDYVMGHSYLNAQITQDVVSATVRGEPFATWAGPVSLAFGLEHRREAEQGESDPLSLVNSYWAGNYKPISGAYTVKEAFLEIVAPLVKDMVWAKSLDLNAAVRATDYSTSGYVTTWKLGLTWAPIDDIRFRATRSRDIRAGNLSELFQAGQTNTTTLVDPFKNDQAYTVFQTTVGNPTVSPEKADTLNLGVVLQPSFVPGFSASVDYFDIVVNDAITTLAASTIVNQCYQGNSVICDLIERDADGFMTEVFRRPINLSRQSVRGLDFEAGYRIPLEAVSASWGAGKLSIRILATRYLESSLDDGISSTTSDLGVNTGTPTWRYLGEIAFDKGPLSLSITGRGFSDGVLNASWIECATNCPTSTIANRTVDNNHVDGAFYVDFGASYRLSDGVKLYVAVDNVANKAPAPYASAGTGIGSAQIGISQTYYDVVGRSFRAGARFQF
ncbi:MULTISPECIES: TonB-dependent receptor [unclassified Sphingobium]|uniref:TonB-dependent receptor n=1 Tax=unclassified Sphingobium TaxID=2611147 RepID=UPI0022242DC4|nr:MULTISPECIES: TonB-dependent receptor [unclassified Sphingobium]MCW2413518.1 outer membrane receptor protein involved in Fe transport [Sphingobium sp. B8D3D]MCW2414182.1 outer membrane receptor protein involved in Fe transport [Sphingobium sp. B8D3A]